MWTQENNLCYSKEQQCFEGEYTVETINQRF